MQELAQPDSLTSSDSLERVFLDLFSNRFDSLISTYGTGNWRSVSRLHYLSDAELNHAVSGKASFLRAVQPDICNSYTVLQVNTGTPQVLNQIGETLRGCGIEHFQIIRNFEPENLQVYIFWDRKVPMVQAADSFDALFEKQILSPCVSVITQNLVLPLQRGSVWLNEDCSIKQSRENLSSEQAEECFLGDLINRPSNFDYVATAIEVTLHGRSADVVMVTATADTGAQSSNERNMDFELKVDAELTSLSNLNLEQTDLNTSQLGKAQSPLTRNSPTQKLLNQKPKWCEVLHLGASTKVSNRKKFFDRRPFKEASIASSSKLINQPPQNAATPAFNSVRPFIADDSKSERLTTQSKTGRTKAATSEADGSARASPKIDSHRQLTLSLTPKAAKEKKLSCKSV